MPLLRGRRMGATLLSPQPVPSKPDSGVFFQVDSQRMSPSLLFASCRYWGWAP